MQWTLSCGLNNLWFGQPSMHSLIGNSLYTITIYAPLSEGASHIQTAGAATAVADAHHVRKTTDSFMPALPNVPHRHDASGLYWLGLQACKREKSKCNNVIYKAANLSSKSCAAVSIMCRKKLQNMYAQTQTYTCDNPNNTKYGSVSGIR